MSINPRYLLTILATIMCCAAIYCQVDSTSVAVVVADTVTLPTIANWFTEGSGPIMSALVIVFGYLSKWIPWVQVQDTTLRVLTFAILLAAGWFYVGGDIIDVAISYATATSLYEVALKKIFPSKEEKLKKKQ